MIFPTTSDLTEGKYNRYEVALAAARCARLVTNEYVRQRNEAESSLTGNKDTDRPLNTMIDRDLRDEKAVKIAINRLYEHTYVITHKSVEEQEKAERAVLEDDPAKDCAILPANEEEPVGQDGLQDGPDDANIPDDADVPAEQLSEAEAAGDVEAAEGAADQTVCEPADETLNDSPRQQQH